MEHTINGHTVSTFYAGFTNYVVDGKVFYSPGEAAKECDVGVCYFHNCLQSEAF